MRQLRGVTPRRSCPPRPPPGRQAATTRPHQTPGLGRSKKQLKTTYFFPSRIQKGKTKENTAAAHCACTPWSARFLYKTFLTASNTAFVFVEGSGVLNSTIIPPRCAASCLPSPEERVINAHSRQTTVSFRTIIVVSRYPWYSPPCL